MLHLLLFFSHFCCSVECCRDVVCVASPSLPPPSPMLSTSLRFGYRYSLSVLRCPGDGKTTKNRTLAAHKENTWCLYFGVNTHSLVRAHTSTRTFFLFFFSSFFRTQISKYCTNSVGVKRRIALRCRYLVVGITDGQAGMACAASQTLVVAWPYRRCESPSSLVKAVIIISSSSRRSLLKAENKRTRCRLFQLLIH